MTSSCLRTEPITPADRQALPKVAFTLVGTFVNETLAREVDKETQRAVIDEFLVRGLDQRVLGPTIRSRSE